MANGESPRISAISHQPFSHQGSLFHQLLGYRLGAGGWGLANLASARTLQRERLGDRGSAIARLKPSRFYEPWLSSFKML